jgi:hypothetical protein
LLRFFNTTGAATRSPGISDRITGGSPAPVAGAIAKLRKIQDKSCQAIRAGKNPLSARLLL